MNTNKHESGTGFPFAKTSEIKPPRRKLRREVRTVSGESTFVSITEWTGHGLHSVAAPAILECGGKRSATPLWLARPGVPAQSKRRRRCALPAHSKSPACRLSCGLLYKHLFGEYSGAGVPLPLGRLAAVFSRARRPFIAGRRPALLFFGHALMNVIS